MYFSETQINEVWEKATKVPITNPAQYRKDPCNAWIVRKNYGKSEFNSGWEIVRINPKGSDKIENLQPVQWNNVPTNKNGKLVCNIISNGSQNESNPKIV